MDLSSSLWVERDSGLWQFQNKQVIFLSSSRYQVVVGFFFFWLLRWIPVECRLNLGCCNLILDRWEQKPIVSYSLFVHPAFVMATDQLSVQQHPNGRAFVNCLMNKVKFCLWADEKVGGMGQWGKVAGVSEGGNSSLYQFVNKDKILHLMEWNAFKPSLEAFQVKRSSCSSKGVTGLYFSFEASIQGLVCQLTKRKLGPPQGTWRQLRLP